MKLLPWLLKIQSTYILATAIWPLVHIKSFLEVTGDKTDIWLVKTVGALLIPVGVTLAAHLLSRTDYRPALVLGALTAVAFICVDFYYALNEVIADIYMLDGLIEGIFLVGWIYIALRNYRSLTTS